MSINMQKRFHAARAERDNRRSAQAPLRAQIDAIRAQQNALDEQLTPLKAKLRESDMPIVGLEREMGLIAKSLNGKTGTP